MRKTKTPQPDFEPKPAVGRKSWLLTQILEKAGTLAKVTELERSGVRDGDGYWHGSDAVGGTMQDIVSLIEQYEQYVTLIEEYERDRTGAPGGFVTDNKRCPF